ncbi:MAG: hypothetical protein RIQ93_926 [Verrucomicrobiota bacterium]|jgi:hypothetical protein
MEAADETGFSECDRRAEGISMNFLAPLFLIGGAALALPVIFHLVRRTTRERRIFGSLMFLLPSPPRISKRHKLEHLLLLLLRCLALALLALGFARPFFRQNPLVDPSAALPKRTVVLVDVSASMRREGLWTSARERVQGLLQQAGPADQVALLTFDRQAAVALSFREWNETPAGDRVALAAARLAAVGPTWSATHLGNALITAAETLAESDTKALPGPRQVVLVSDVQAGSRLDVLQAYEWPQNIGLIIHSLKAGNKTNAGLQLVADSAEAPRTADPVVRVRVSNSGDAKREQFKIGWARESAGAAADRGADFVGEPIEVYVPPGQSRIVALPVSKEPKAQRVILRGDDDDFDNTLFVIPPVQQNAQVLWLGGKNPDDTRQPLFFLRRALSDTPRLVVQVVSHPAAAPLAWGEAEAAQLIFATEPLSGPAATALRERMLAGKTVVFLPKAADASATLGALLGRASVPVTEIRPGNYAMFAEIDFQHPLFAPFADPRFSDFTKIRFWKYRKIDLSGVNVSRVVARFDSGDPALVEIPVGRGRLFILAAGWQPEDSQLAVSSKFVPLVWSLLETSGGYLTAPSQYFVGDKVALPAERTSLSVKAPGSDAATALPASATEFGGTSQPGIYEFSTGAKVSRFGVNLDPGESRTAPLAADELERLGVPVTPLAPAGADKPETRALLQAAEAENRQKLWRWFIAATLAVLLMETALAGRTARRAANQPLEVAS